MVNHRTTHYRSGVEGSVYCLSHVYGLKLYEVCLIIFSKVRDGRTIELHTAIVD